jgi:hypothetical protein
MLSKLDREEMQQYLEDPFGISDLRTNFPSELLAKEYLSLYEKYTELKWKMKGLEK